MERQGQAGLAGQDGPGPGSEEPGEVGMLRREAAGDEDRIEVFAHRAQDVGGDPVAHRNHLPGLGHIGGGLQAGDLFLDGRPLARFGFDQFFKFVFFLGIKWRTKGLRLKFIDKIINFLAR